eukprot:gene2386-26607_t
MLCAVLAARARRSVLLPFLLACFWVVHMMVVLCVCYDADPLWGGGLSLVQAATAAAAWTVCRRRDGGRADTPPRSFVSTHLVMGVYVAHVFIQLVTIAVALECTVDWELKKQVTWFLS